MPGFKGTKNLFRHGHDSQHFIPDSCRIALSPEFPHEVRDQPEIGLLYSTTQGRQRAEQLFFYMKDRPSATGHISQGYSSSQQLRDNPVAQNPPFLVLAVAPGQGVCQPKSLAGLCSTSTPPIPEWRRGKSKGRAKGKD